VQVNNQAREKKARTPYKKRKNSITLKKERLQMGLAGGRNAEKTANQSKSKKSDCDGANNSLRIGVPIKNLRGKNQNRGGPGKKCNERQCVSSLKKGSQITLFVWGGMRRARARQGKGKLRENPKQKRGEQPSPTPVSE